MVGMTVFDALRDVFKDTLKQKTEDHNVPCVGIHRIRFWNKVVEDNPNQKRTSKRQDQIQLAAEKRSKPVIDKCTGDGNQKQYEASDPHGT
jgi:hypothetical protein